MCLTEEKAAIILYKVLRLKELEARSLKGQLDSSWCYDFEGPGLNLLSISGYCTPNQKLACFVLYLKIINTLLKNFSKLSKELKHSIEI